MIRMMDYLKKWKAADVFSIVKFDDLRNTQKKKKYLELSTENQTDKYAILTEMFNGAATGRNHKWKRGD